uniref:TLC domain-containing protein n=1 Tax=Accipiter nisus TaxID=211598 RepID=A0A8B9MDS7_9AVES
MFQLKYFLLKLQEPVLLVWLSGILLPRKQSSLPALALLYLMSISLSLPPSQPLQPSLFWYYLLELSFYWSLVFTLPFDVKRKDFKEQIVHHAATIFLISFSYCANYIRIGTLVMVIHDASDCFLEPTKIFNYMKWKKTCDSLFMIFSAVFLISRLVIYPYTVLYNTYYYSMEIFQPFFGYYFMNGLLIILQLLHVFWSCLIIHMVYKFILQGTVWISFYSPVHHMGREGRVHLGCLGAQEFIWDGFLLALVKLYMYIPSSGLKGTLTIIRES